MINSLDVCKCAISILFSCRKTDLPKMKSTFVDAEASLLSELSHINNELKKITVFHHKLIESQYIDYLKREISTLKQSSLSEDTISKFNKIFSSNAEISDGLSDIRLGKDLSYAGSKLADILDGDITRTQVLMPILKSKSYDFLLLLSEEVDRIALRSDKVKSKIADCEIFMEAISFCEYIFLTEIGDREGIPTILENNYDGLMSEISVRYSKWKGLI